MTDKTSNVSGIKSNMAPSKIIGVQFSIISPEETLRASVAEIKTRDTYTGNVPVINGLFDPRMGVLENGIICPTDGLGYMQTPGYFGHIRIARPLFYIQFLNTVLKIARCVCFNCSKLLIDKDKYRELLNRDAGTRWDEVFALASKVRRCGEENPDGCNYKQPNKIYKEGLANVFAEWDEMSYGTKEQVFDKEEALTMRVTPEIMLRIFKRISDEDITFMGFSPVFSRPEWMICQVIIVPPPAIRPSVKQDAQQRSEDDITHNLVQIIKANKRLQEQIEKNAPESIIEDYTTLLQYFAATMINNKIPGVDGQRQRSGKPLKSITERLGTKTGRVRGNLMGKRVDFAGRSVITADPNLSMRELGVPKKVAMNITYPVVVNERNMKFLRKLVENGPDVYPGAKILEKKSGEQISLRYVDRKSIELKIGDTVHRHMINGDVVLFNRQPTLHRMSMMAHIARIMFVGDTFRMNVACTKPYNADFDGDEMNMHMPQDDEASAELRNLAATHRQIISPANNASIIGIFQDSLLGCFRFTRENINFTPKEAMNLLMGYKRIDEKIFAKDGDRTTKRISNFEVLSQILPPMSTKFANKLFEDGEDKKTSNNVVEIQCGQYLRGQIEKGVLAGGSKGLIQRIYNDYSTKASADFVDNLSQLITEYMKHSAFSVGISDLIANTTTNQEIADAINKKKQAVYNIIEQVKIGVFENNTGRSNADAFETEVNNILNKAQEEAGKIGRKSLDKNNRFITLVNCGSKGTTLNIAQMIACLGQQNVDGKRIPYGFEDRTLPHFSKFDDTPEARGFVKNSFIQGLDPPELFAHAVGGRVGLIDTAVKTSQTGYIQRRLIKGLEDIGVAYDMTCRNNMGKIVQFQYGDDGIDTTKVETQSIPIVKMTVQDIYAYFQVGTDGATLRVYEATFTPDAIKRMRQQDAETKARTIGLIDEMLVARDELMKHVFKMMDDDKVHVPVHFQNIVTNVKNQLLLQSNSIVDITPFETFELLDSYFNKLKVMTYNAPTHLFEILYKFYLCPNQLLLVNRFNRNAIIYLLELIVSYYKNAMANPGEMVGMIAAQSIGEPTTQMTLNTFHNAGISSKSNVTRGVPRIEEVLSLSKEPKNPSMTIFLKEEEETNKQKAMELMSSFEYTSLKDVVSSVGIYYDPDDLNTIIEQDRDLVEQFKSFENMVKMSGSVDTNGDGQNNMMKWIVRFEFDKETMLDRNITMDDINFAIQNCGYSGNMSCIYSDYNDSRLIMRVRPDVVKPIRGTQKVANKGINFSDVNIIDQTDHIVYMKNIQDNLVNNVIIRGVKDISKVMLRKIQNSVVKDNHNYVKRESWVLDTVGTNLIDMLGLDNIDTKRTYSNDIIEIYNVLGIEAVRQCILNEVSEVIEFDGTYINYHHLAMLADRMTMNCKLVSIFRHGINNDNIGPIAKASFEETPEMFLKAAKHAELDNMRGVSANVMCGQEGYFGTSAFQVLLDVAEMAKLGDKETTDEATIEDQLGAFGDEDKCSISTIKIKENVVQTFSSNTGMVDTDYDALSEF